MKPNESLGRRPQSAGLGASFFLDLITRDHHKIARGEFERYFCEIVWSVFRSGGRIAHKRPITKESAVGSGAVKMFCRRAIACGFSGIFALAMTWDNAAFPSACLQGELTGPHSHEMLSTSTEHRPES